MPCIRVAHQIDGQSRRALIPLATVRLVITERTLPAAFLATTRLQLLSRAGESRHAHWPYVVGGQGDQSAQQKRRDHDKRDQRDRLPLPGDDSTSNGLLHQPVGGECRYERSKSREYENERLS